MMTVYDALAQRTHTFAVPLAQAFATVQQNQALAGSAPRPALTIDVMHLVFGEHVAALLAAQICAALRAPEFPPGLTPLEWKHLTLGAIAALRREHVDVDASALPRLDTQAALTHCIAILGEERS